MAHAENAQHRVLEPEELAGMATLLASDDGARHHRPGHQRRRRVPPLSVVRRKLRRQWHPNARTSPRRCATSSASSCDGSNVVPDHRLRHPPVGDRRLLPGAAPRPFWDAEYAASTVARRDRRARGLQPVRLADRGPRPRRVWRRVRRRVRGRGGGLGRARRATTALINGGTEVEYGVRMRPGDVITSVTTLGGLLGTGRTPRADALHHQRGHLDQSAGRDGQDVAQHADPVLTMAVDRDTVSVGTELPPFVRTTGFHNWNRYAAVNDEFVPIHMDDEAGRAQGFPARSAWATSCGRTCTTSCATGWATTAASSRMTCSFRAPNNRGMTVEARGTVTAVRDEDGERLVDLDLVVRRPRHARDGAGAGDRDGRAALTPTGQHEDLALVLGLDELGERVVGASSPTRLVTNAAASTRVVPERVDDREELAPRVVHDEVHR